VGYRKFEPKFKRRVVEQWRSGEKGIAQICREHQLADSLVRRWRAEYEERGPNAWESAARRDVELEAAQRRVAELEAALGRSSMEVDFLRRALKRAGIPFPPELKW
jgi:putative transposase